MSDELVKRHVEQLRMTGGDLADLCQPLADAIEALAAERERLRDALWAILACETPNANATVTRMAAVARAALKGETP